MSPAKDTLGAGKDETQSSTSRKPTSARPQEPAVKCPRCDSPNTKFCYYNNYSLTQPRHFCKTCRRYWTKGGALRNVPIGGGCRKNKKIKPSPRDDDSSGSSDAGAFKFFQGGLPPAAMDFQLAAAGINMPYKLVHSTNTAANLFNPFQSNMTGCQPQCFNLDPPPLMGFGFPLSSSSSLKQGESYQEMGSSVNVRNNILASSIESLSSINQDLHWKLQQQRLATLFVEDGRQNQKEEASRSINEPVIVQKVREPIQFQNLENPKTTTTTTEYSCLNNNMVGTSSSLRKDGNLSNNNSSEWFFNAPTTTTSNGIQAWSSHELSPYTSLP